MVTRARITPGDGDRRHGTTNGYSNLTCRCSLCRNAWSLNMREYRAQKAGSLSPTDPRHGSWSTYTNYSCRCQRCHEAASQYLRGGDTSARTH